MSKQIVIQSHGMGVESQAIFERWVADPSSRPFDSWDQLIVVTAQVGEEHKKDTIRDMEARTLPLMRELGVRFVELARRGHLEEDGIVILQDTREPYKLHPDGCYKLSDELLSSGTVPQFGGEHRCAMKFKAFVIETWLAWEFRGEDKPVYHVFGYNADETIRIDNSEHHIARHNADREIECDRTPIMVFGFNSEEIGRIDRAKKYDGPNREGNYPLQLWGWNREKCEAYIFEQTGIRWRKSHCAFCPFCAEASKGESNAVRRWLEDPIQAAHGLLVEYNSLCFNPRGHLYRDRAMIDVVKRLNLTEVLAKFEEKLNSVEWGFYRVRRIYTKKGKAARCVELVKTGSRKEMEALINAQDGRTEFKRGIMYIKFQDRAPDVYPTLEGFYVAAPAYMITKLRGPIERFDERWNAVKVGGSMEAVRDEDEQEVAA